MDMSVANRSPTQESPTRTLLGKKASGEMENKIPCKYGSECYRKNPAHFREFSHPDGTARRSAAQSHTLARVLNLVNLVPKRYEQPAVSTRQLSPICKGLFLIH